VSGPILDFKMFGDLTLTLLVEIEGTFLLDFPDGDGELAIPPPRVPG
jgi:hypothetical protein